MGSPELLLVLGLIMGGLAVFLLVSAVIGQTAEKGQLSWANNAEPKKSRNAIINFSRPIAHQFTLQHAKKVKSEDYRRTVQRHILTAGLSQELNIDEFIGLQILWGVMFPLFMLVMNFGLEMGLPTFLLVLMVPLGIYLPIMHAKGEKKRREAAIRSDLPFFVDLLSLSVEAGLDFFSAIQKIVDKSRGSTSVLSEEFSIVMKDIQIGSSKQDALKEMSKRCDMPEVNSFVAMLVDAEATGSPVTQVLRDQSAQMRLERFVRAEKAGARASQMIMLPLVMFIFPTIILMVFGPVIIQYMGGK